MPINHDICQLSKKKLTPGVAEPKCALQSSSLTRVQSFVHLFLFEVTVVFGTDLPLLHVSERLDTFCDVV